MGVATKGKYSGTGAYGGKAFVPAGTGGSTENTVCSASLFGVKARGFFYALSAFDTNRVESGPINKDVLDGGRLKLNLRPNRKT